MPRAVKMCSESGASVSGAAVSGAVATALRLRSIGGSLGSGLESHGCSKSQARIWTQIRTGSIPDLPQGDPTSNPNRPQIGRRSTPDSPEIDPNLTTSRP